MTEPKVSVIVATYRRDESLKNALESIAVQAYRNFEIIIVDDNDDAVWNAKVSAVVESFKVQNPDISFIYIENHPNLGSARTRNVGIEVASGDYICFLDDDDLYLPGRIQNQVAAMEVASADYGLTDLALYTEADSLIEIRKRDYIEDTSEQSLLKYHLMHHMTGTDTLMFKSEYLKAMGGFDPIDVGDEFYLMLKAIRHGGKFLYVSVCDVKAYVHTGEEGLSSGQSKINGENMLYAYKKKYFTELDKKTVKYIKMRHHLVLAFAYLRMKQYVSFFVEGVKAVLCDVTGSIKFVLNRK